MIEFQENLQTDARWEGWADPISQHPCSYCQGSNKYNWHLNHVDWHLKVKVKKCYVSLTKNYCITVSMQKISSIHKLSLLILGSHEINDHTHPKITEITFSFPEFAPACQKSFHQFILEIQPILESCDHTSPNYFWPCPPKNILINF